MLTASFVVLFVLGVLLGVVMQSIRERQYVEKIADRGLNTIREREVTIREHEDTIQELKARLFAAAETQAELTEEIKQRDHQLLEWVGIAKDIEALAAQTARQGIDITTREDEHIQTTVMPPKAPNARCSKL